MVNFYSNILTILDYTFIGENFVSREYPGEMPLNPLPLDQHIGVSLFVIIGPRNGWRQVGTNQFLEPMLTLHR